MLKKRPMTVISLVIVAMVCGTGQVYAVKAQAPKTDGDPAQNNHLKRQITPHSQRERAAKRLKLHHQMQRQEKIDRWVNSHHGYTGLGQHGNGSSSHQLSANNGVLK